MRLTDYPPFGWLTDTGWMQEPPNLPPVTPPVDLGKPAENPELLAQLLRMGDSPPRE
jgi:hypothetical protein